MDDNLNIPIRNRSLADHRLTKKERLNRRDFQSIKWKWSKETDHFALLMSRNDKGLKRIGITIKKRQGGAVLRNRLRRLIKEYFRLNKEAFKDSHDHLVKVKEIPQKLLWKEIDLELKGLLDGDTT